MFSPYDMSTSAITTDGTVKVWDTEIKVFSPDNPYPNFIIKVDKIVRVLQESRRTIVLACVVGADAYLYKIREIDWGKLQKKEILANKVEYDPSQGKTKELHYFLPKKYAKYVLPRQPKTPPKRKGNI